MTDNQKIILEHLKYAYSLYGNSFDTVWDLMDDYMMNGFENEELDYAMEHIKPREQFEVLIKFGEWGLKNE